MGWRDFAISAALFVLLVGGASTAGYAFHHQQVTAYRIADTATLSQTLLQLYVLGQEEGGLYPELRDYVQTHQQYGLLAAAVTDKSGRLRNIYEVKPGAAKSAHRMATPIQGQDGVVRDQVELYYASAYPLPTRAHILNWAGGGLLAYFFATFLWVYRRASREAELSQLRILEATAREQEARMRILEAEQREKDAQLRILQAEQREKDAQLNILQAEQATVAALWDAYRELLDEESGRLANRLQEMGNVVAHLNANLTDVVHDLRKSPLGSGDLYKVDNLLAKLRNPKVEGCSSFKTTGLTRNDAAFGDRAA